VVDTVPVGRAPWYVAVNHEIKKAYVTNRGDNTVSVMNTENHAVEAVIKVGEEPLAVAFLKNRAFVTNCGSNDVTVIDTTNNSVIDTITLPGMKPESGLCPWGIAGL
jgi:YVTN family beta-propeller protein